MAVQLKTVGLFDVKTEGEPDGVFTAYASTYDVDSVGDKVKFGAFGASLKSWAESGNSIPLLWSHRMDDPDMNLGHVLDAKEHDGRGLWTKNQLDLENPKAVQAYRLLKGKRIRNLSFAYDTLDRASVMHDGKSVNELRELKLYEVSLTPIGANQHTQVLGVKAASEFLNSLTPEVVAAADAVELGRALAKASDILAGVLSGVTTPPADEPPTKESNRRAVMGMKVALAAVVPLG